MLIFKEVHNNFLTAFLTLASEIRFLMKLDFVYDHGHYRSVV